MKSRIALPTLIVSAGLAGLHAPALAENVPSVEPEATSPAADNAPGFLGVAVAETLAPPNAGPGVPGTVLVVSDVMPESPADAAGLRSGDVLLKVDGQLLLHPTQLTRLVPTYPAGQEIDLTILRGGEQIKQKAILAERPVQLAEPPAAFPRAEVVPFAEWEAVPFEFQPNDLQNDLREMRERMDRQFEQMRQMFRDGLGEGWPADQAWEDGDPIKLDFDFELGDLPDNMGQKVTILQDNKHKLTITQTAETRLLNATDAEGNVLFDGPIDTQEQLDAVPEDIRKKIPERGLNMPLQFRELMPDGWPHPHQRPDNNPPQEPEATPNLKAV
ncbi:MAG: PDZ domain-containing protein [Planctomycetota bacterium]